MIYIHLGSCSLANIVSQLLPVVRGDPLQGSLRLLPPNILRDTIVSFLIIRIVQLTPLPSFLGHWEIQKPIGSTIKWLRWPHWWKHMCSSLTGSLIFFLPSVFSAWLHHQRCCLWFWLSFSKFSVDKDQTITNNIHYSWDCWDLY